MTIKAKDRESQNLPSGLRPSVRLCEENRKTKTRGLLLDEGEPLDSAQASGARDADQVHAKNFESGVA